MKEINPIQVWQNGEIVTDDGVELSRSFHRHSLSPGDDVSNEDARVQAIANVIWTEEVVNDYKALIAPIEPTPSDDDLE